MTIARGSGGTLAGLALAALLAACGGDAVGSAEEYCAGVARMEERGGEIFADVDQTDPEALRAAEAQVLEAVEDEGLVPPAEVAEDYEGFLAGLRGRAEGQETTSDQVAAEERLLAWEAEHCTADG